MRRLLIALALLVTAGCGSIRSAPPPPPADGELAEALEHLERLVEQCAVQ